MRRILSGSAVALAAVLFASVPSSAITNGTIDGGAHPEVGALISEFGSPPVKEFVCSGTLIAPRVFLTAGHCTDFLTGTPASKVWVSFDQDVDPVTGSTTLYQASSYTTNPAYNSRGNDPGDLGVVQFPADIPITPASLPTAGLLDSLNLKGRTFTAVGYGSEQAQKGGGPQTFPLDGERRWAVSTFNALNKAWLRLSANVAKGEGGTCYGDSGGPNFLGSGGGETTTIAAITVTGDVPCYSTNVDYRVDTASARSFLGHYVALP